MSRKPKHERDDFDLSQYQIESDGEEAVLRYFHQTKKIPLESLEGFIQDLSLDYSDMKKSGVKEIDAIIRGDADFLGKGFDGIVFATGNRVVKVSTTVPFHPMNQQHRTPRQACDHTLKEAKLMDMLRRKGITCVLPAVSYIHEGRAWIVKPFLDLVEPKNLTQKQVNALANCVYAIHEEGLVLGDTLQIGSYRGKMYFLDLGQVRKGSAEDRRQDVLEIRALSNAAGVLLEKDSELENDMVRRAKYLRFVLRPPGNKKAIEDAALKLSDVFYSLPSSVQMAHKEVEDLIEEALFT